MSNEYDAHSNDSENNYSNSDESAHDSLPTHSIVHSDDDSSDTPTAPPAPTTVIAQVADGTRNPHADMATGPRTIHTARKAIRRLPTQLLALQNETSDDSDEQSDEPLPKRLKFAHLSWMPGLLRHWRALEGIPSTFEIGESSRAPQSIPITDEPMELTVPTLVAMTNLNTRNLHEVGTEILELQSDTSRLDGDMITTYQQLDTIEERMATDREIAQTTLARVEAMERRARAAEVMAGISLMMFGAIAAMAMFSFYPH